MNLRQLAEYAQCSSVLHATALSRSVQAARFAATLGCFYQLMPCGRLNPAEQTPSKLQMALQYTCLRATNKPTQGPHGVHHSQPAPSHANAVDTADYSINQSSHRHMIVTAMTCLCKARNRQLCMCPHHAQQHSGKQPTLSITAARTHSRSECIHQEQRIWCTNPAK